MNFRYSDYNYMIGLLKRKKYNFCNYKNYNNFKKFVILRHDIDFKLEDALEIAKIEKDNDINSTYFVLVSSDFYNVFSLKSSQILKDIISLGHEIGLHFDETKYKINDIDKLEFYINKEKETLKQAIDKDVNSVSMHRPSKWLLDSNIKFDNLINTYSKYFFKEIKYLSDSRMLWRENVLDIIEKQNYNKLHILTHPFWYSDKEENMESKIYDFINDAKIDRYKLIQQNFKNLESVLTMQEINC